MSSDRKAAFTGLILGFIALAIVVVTIVILTNLKFARHEGAAPTASAVR
jgi:hypothetical protein